MIAKPKYTVMIDVIGLGLLCVMMLRFAWVGHFGSNGIFAETVDRAILMACTFIFGSGSLAYVWFRISRMSLADKDIT